MDNEPEESGKDMQNEDMLNQDSELDEDEDTLGNDLNDADDEEDEEEDEEEM